ncbi:MAG: nucleotidyltransferase family protein [bacterium]
MKQKTLTIKEIKHQITPILKKSGVVRSALFGSYARGEATSKSDVDLIIEMKKPQGIFFTIGLKLDLEEKLKKKVDLLTPGAINHRLKKYINKDVIEIYNQRTR